MLSIVVGDIGSSSVIKILLFVCDLQIEVFGQQLNPGEFDSLKESEQIEKSEQMMDIIRKHLEDEREKELRNKDVLS